MLVLSSPIDQAQINNNKPSFDWQDVSDPSGVTYSLLVDNDNTFGSPEISASALATSAFTPTAATPALTDGIYYWKVNANDGDGNVGPFSSVFSFTVDTTSPTVKASPSGGVFNVDQSVTLSLPPTEPTTTKIHYTTDNSDPTTSSTLYTSPVPITTEGQTTLKFRAVDAAGNLGTVGIALFTIDKTTPTVLSYGTCHRRHRCGR